MGSRHTLRPRRPARGDSEGAVSSFQKLLAPPLQRGYRPAWTAPKRASGARRWRRLSRGGSRVAVAPPER
eukprot:383419-Alexandrium_andersonii.AAC.1